MADGAIRNQPWCRGCRSGAGAKKPAAPEATLEASAVATEEAPLAPMAAAPLEELPAFEEEAQSPPIG